jgi:sugar phosphate isomerase/epimerase
MPRTPYAPRNAREKCQTGLEARPDTPSIRDASDRDDYFTEGTGFLVAVCVGDKDTLIEEFALLCQDAQERGTKIAFEMMPFSTIDSLQSALELVEGAGAKNGGVIFDLWHIVKLGIPYEKVWQFPREYFLGVEINDGYIKNLPTQDLVEETTQYRKLCGEGEFDIKGFMKYLPASHYNGGPIGIEVLSKDLRDWPLEKVAKAAFDTTLAQIPAA